MRGHSLPQPRAATAAQPSPDWRIPLVTNFSWALFLGGLPLVVYALLSISLVPSTRVAFWLLIGASLGSALARRSPVRTRGLILVVVMLGVGTTLARNAGPSAGTFLCLALAAVLAVLVFGRRAGLAVLAVGTASFLGFGLAGRSVTGLFWAPQLMRTDVWIRMAGTYALFGGLLVLLVSNALRARTEAEDELRGNAERLRLALEAARMGTWEWDISSGTVRRGAQTAALLGLPAEGLPGTFEQFKESLHPDDRPAMEQAIAGALAGTGTLDIEFRVRTDPPRWLQSSGLVYRDEAGRPLLMRGTVADITARKQSEDALRESEAELRALFASMQDVTLVLDGDGRYLRVAPTDPSRLYRPREELLGRTLHEVFPAEQADAFLAQIHRCLKTRQTVRFDYELPIAGAPTWFAATVSPMTDDKVVWVARDDTERRRAEETVRESEQRWRRLSEATFEGVAFSQEGIMFDVNDQLAAMLGYPLAEMIGKPVMDCVAPEDRAKVADAIRMGHTTAYQHRALRKDGSTLVVETRARGLTLRGQQIRVTAIRDVTERLHLEAELRRRETLAAMGSLVAGVAHEVRTPLFSLSATLDALEAGVGSADQQHELKDLLRSQVRRLSNLMQDLLDYGRPPRLKLARGGLPAPILRVARSCGSLAAQSGVRIVLELPDGLPEIEADPVRLEQVFENLVTNALHHAPRGSSVRITARAVAGPPAGILCAVEDEGPGLPPGDLDRIFEPFFSRRQGGTGMGLAIAERLVEAHGGALTAANGPRGGAVFTVFLPVADARRAEGTFA
jgi:PAS domain S-box-containing protein